MTPIVDAEGMVLGKVEVLHPGPGESFTGGHRRFPGGVLTREGAILVLPGLLRARATSAGLLLVRRLSPGRLALLRWKGGRLRVIDQVQASDLRPGGAWRTRWAGAEAALETLDGAPVPAPLGARRAHPWPDQAGLCWADGAALLRLQPGHPALVVGVLDGPVRGLQVGPGGAMVAWTAHSSFALAPGAGPLALPISPPLRSVAFKPDGRWALVEDDLGTHRVDLDTGAVDGFQADARPSRWDQVVDVSGEEHAWDQDSAEEVLLPGPGVVLDGMLHGPGGLCWDLRTGEPVAGALTAGADLALRLGPGLLLADEDELRFVNADGEEELLLELEPEDPALDLVAGREGRQPFAVLRTQHRVAWGGRRGASWTSRALRLPAGGALLSAQVDGRVLVPSADGDLLLPQGQGPGVPAPASTPPPALVRLGLPWDGWTRAPDGRLWAWVDDGPLLRLTADAEASG